MRFDIRPLSIILALSALSVAIAPSAGAATNEKEFLGRWDITIAAAEKAGPRNCWLEVTKEAGTLKGRFNQGGGAVFPLKEIAIEKGELTFQHPIGRPADNQSAVYRARVQRGKLEGTAVFGKASPQALKGIRPPSWPAELPARKPGKAIALFNGKDMSGWLGQNTGKPIGWKVKDGTMINDDHPAGTSADNIFTGTKFQDFKLEVEFNVAAKSNSGIYLRGRYEIQVMDDVGRALDAHSQGALYGFIVPGLLASKPAGEWQKFDITLIANRVTVVLNGTKIIDNGEIPGITGGALDANENLTGPIMLQGDHGLIQYRKVLLTPLN